MTDTSLHDLSPEDGDAWAEAAAESARNPWHPDGPNADLYWQREYLIEKGRRILLEEKLAAHSDGSEEA